MELQDPDAFLADPCAWADPGRAAALLAPGLRQSTAQWLMTSPRTAARASRLLSERLGQGSLDALEPADRGLALAPAAALRAVAAAAGAVWHAARVRNLLRAQEINALAAQHGPDVRAAALRHAALSPRPDVVPGEELGDAVARDGARCIAAWIAALPAWAGDRIRLKWTDDAAPPADPALQAQATAIVRAVAADRMSR